MATTAQGLVSFSVNGQSLGNWATASDIGREASPTKRYKPDGSETTDKVRATTSDLTLTKVYEDSSEADMVMTLLNGAGRADVSVSIADTDLDGVPTGTSLTSTGTLGNASISGVDVNGTDSRMITVVLVLTKWKKA